MELKDILKKDKTVCECYKEIVARYSAARVEYRSTADFINNNYSEIVRKTLADADEYMAGWMVLPGTGGKPCFVGNPPRWSDNPTEDNEYVFVLNRMELWPVLIKAYYLTGNDTYARKVLDELDNWIDSCPPLPIALDYDTAKPRFSAPTPWRTLELGIRAHRSWNHVIIYLGGSPLFTQRLFDKLAVSMRTHAEILYRVCPVLWPKADHNHYLTECLGLLEISCIMDFLEEAPTWRIHALRELERCVAAQVLPMGGQIEGCPTYHNECLHWLTYSLGLARRYSLELSEEYMCKVKLMINHTFFVTRPDGNSVPWGDSDIAPHIFTAVLHHYNYTGDKEPLRRCAAYFPVNMLIDAVADCIWELPHPELLLKEIENPDFTGATAPLPALHYDRELKQVMMRTKWSPSATSLFFACRSPVHNDHAHIDPNGFDFFAAGLPVLVDPGRYTYRESLDRKQFKSTDYHNTLLVNNQNAFEYLGTWSYGDQQEGDILAAAEVGGLQYAIGRHMNYAPVRHTRLIALDDDLLLVVDLVEDVRSDDTVQIYYHFDFEFLQVDDVGHSVTAKDDKHGAVMVYSDDMTASVLPGMISPSIDIAHASSRLKLEAKATQQLFAVAIASGSGNVPKLCDIKVKRADGAVEITLTYQGKLNRYLWNTKNNSLGKD